MEIVRNLNIAVVYPKCILFTMTLHKKVAYFDAIEICCNGIGFIIKDSYDYNYCYPYLIERYNNCIKNGMILS